MASDVLMSLSARKNSIGPDGATPGARIRTSKKRHKPASSKI
jgi:hypothetical protein